jgi:hypothetical protein
MKKSTDELIEMSAEYFNSYPDATHFHATHDGLFFMPAQVNEAHAHHKFLGGSGDPLIIQRDEVSIETQPDGKKSAKGKRKGKGKDKIDSGVPPVVDPNAPPENTGTEPEGGEQINPNAPAQDGENIQNA